MGQVRLDRVGGGWEISVSLATEAQGRGLSVPLIEAALEQLDERDGGSVEAWVRPANTRSRAAFERAGFINEPERGNEDFLVLTRRV